MGLQNCTSSGGLHHQNPYSTPFENPGFATVGDVVYNNICSIQCVPVFQQRMCILREILQIYENFQSIRSDTKFKVLSRYLQ